ncbi:MAG: ABC transporter substrate-binding protein, partial [Boseongicola sp.]|nr:ABC transporter substrate-binding protein [Boseongicola sp.]
STSSDIDAHAEMIRSLERLMSKLEDRTMDAEDEMAQLAQLAGDEHQNTANALIQEANPEMSSDKIAYAIEKMLENGIVDSGDALEKGIGVITDAKVMDFYAKMVEAGVIEDTIDPKTAYNTSWVGTGLGMDLK